MSSESVLLINLKPDEVRIIQEVLPLFEEELAAREVMGIEDAESILSEGNTRLIVMRIDEGFQRPDQAIRRLKRTMASLVPLLVLVPPELTQKVKDCFHAGADDYWVLPLDSTSFPPRLFVMLEWGQAMMHHGEQSLPVGAWASVREVGSVWGRIRNGIQCALPFLQPKSPLKTGETAMLGDKWEMQRRLGFGSFGEVWLVRNRDGDQLAVAKIPHSKKMNTKFLREGAILRRLGAHPNTAQLKEIVKEEGRAILIQEYAEGSTLQELFDQRMESTFKEKAFLDLLDIVAHAHSHNIMHRDIKPENIIITPSGKLKLLDFGTAKDLTRRSISNTIIGSRPFMAPEQIMGKSRLASDVWALGVILYALATECLPFYDDNEKQLMDMILEVNPEPPRNLEPDLPEELEAIILKCLEKDWNRRYKNAVELRSDLLEALPRFGEGKVLP